MLPLLEMSGTANARHIPEALMVYNQLNPHAAGLNLAEEMRRNAIYLEQQRPYRPLPSAAADQPRTTEANWQSRTLNS
jgi:hypothetical protein